MDKNDFDVDFDFEEEYGFDPKDFLSEDEDFDFSDILEEDTLSDHQDDTRKFHIDPSSEASQDGQYDGSADEDLTADFPEHTDQQEAAEPEDDDVRIYGQPEEEQEEALPD